MNSRVPMLFLAAALSVAACQSGSRGVSRTLVKPPARLLFIGNSFTYYNGGLENHVRELAASARPPKFWQTDRAAKGGATLKILQAQGWVHEKIRMGGYDLVVLQEDIPELTEHTVTPFLEQVRRFDAEIRGVGGRTVLFMAWPYERLNWVSLPQIEQAHRAIARELSLPVAPVGRAFERALRLRPSLPMLGPDREHETLHGTYLAACVIHATILGERPMEWTYCPAGISPEEAAFLQSVAWETITEWQREGQQTSGGHS